MAETCYYFVTDVETNGPSPSLHSMLSFASIVVNSDGDILGEFEAVLKPRPEYDRDQSTVDWWKNRPEAYAAATKNPVEPQIVMSRYAEWIRSYSGMRVFAARPLIFDGHWIDEYLRIFVKSSILLAPYQAQDLFTGAGLDIPSYMMGVLGHSKHMKPPYQIPAEWLGNQPHTHRAIDDAHGYANLLSKLLKLANMQEPLPSDFSE